MMQEWDNQACKGYCITAMQWAGYSLKEIGEVLDCMRGAFDAHTLEDAARVYKKYMNGELKDDDD